MARYENDFNRSNQLAWGEPHGNGHRGRSATQGPYAGGPSEYGGWGSGEGQGEYGGQGYSAMGDFSGRGFAGPSGWQEDEGQGYGRQGMGWHQEPGGYGMGREMAWRQRAFAGPDIGEEGRFGPWRAPGYGGYGPTSRGVNEGYGPRGFGASPGWRPERGPGPAGQDWRGRAGAGGYWGQGAIQPGYVPGEQRAWEQRQIGGWGEMPFGSQGYGGPGSEMIGPEGWSEGPYSGRGPRGYQRSDARIEEDVNERLTRHPLLDASDIEVRVRGGEVTLSGMVDSRRAKRLAEDILEAISGIKDINNQLRVQHDRAMSERMEGAETSGATRSQSQATRGQSPRAETAKATAGRSAA